jgi:hypothetical protein
MSWISKQSGLSAGTQMALNASRMLVNIRGIHTPVLRSVRSQELKLTRSDGLGTLYYDLFLLTCTDICKTLLYLYVVMLTLFDAFRSMGDRLTFRTHVVTSTWTRTSLRSVSPNAVSDFFTK